MGSSASYVLLALSLFFYILGMAAIVVGIIGNAWFIIDKFNEGLIETCALDALGKENCIKRESFLKFEDNDQGGQEKDIVLMMLMASVVVCFIAFTIALVMICCRKSKSAWRCSAVASFVFGVIAALLGLAALGYSESKFSTKWDLAKHGWANILSWVGCAGEILAAVLTILLVCVTPVTESSHHGVHYVGKSNPTYQHDYRY